MRVAVIESNPAEELAVECVQPLVSVAVPTFQRPDALRRAIESILAQDYPNIEILISDNASGEETADMIAGLVRRHDNVRAIRQSENIGPTRNFEALRTLGSGAYFMFLGDDDWLDERYVSTCVGELQADDTLALVGGRAIYHRSDASTFPERRPVQVDSSLAPRRVIQYLSQVEANGIFYGVAPMELAREVPELRNALGGDLLFIANLAYLGRVRTIDGVHVHRSVGGMTSSLANVARGLGLGWFSTYLPQLSIGWRVFREILFDSPVFAREAPVRRLILAIHGVITILRRFLPHAVAQFFRLFTRGLADRWHRARRIACRTAAEDTCLDEGGR